MSTVAYVGQLPGQPLRITVGGVDLADYAAVEVRMTDPAGTAVDLTGGSVLLDEAAAGVVKYSWGPTSPFTMVGDYSVRLRLTGVGVLDYSTPATIEVYRAEGQ